MTTSPEFRGRVSEGFTLIEMLIVLGVILVLISIGIPNFMNALKRARISSAKVQIQNYKAAVAVYHTDTRQYPPSGSWHLYYILGGVAPFREGGSRRYKPPYIEFTPKEVGKKIEDTGSEVGYDTIYRSNADVQIKAAAAPGEVPTSLSADDLFKPSPLQQKNPAIKYFALLDPWNRPIIYISPDDLEAWFEETSPPGGQDWSQLIAVSDIKRVNKKGTTKNVPFGMNSGQFWSAGPDGETARPNTQYPGLFQPGNLSPDDGRDNDLDQLTDVSDPKPAAEAGKYSLAEDDINSWN